MSWIEEADAQAKSMGFRSVMGDIKYWLWVVDNDFPPPWDKAEAIDKQNVLLDVYAYRKKEEEFFNEKMEYCGIPYSYRKTKPGKISELAMQPPITGMNNFFFLVDSLRFTGEDKGVDPKDTGKTTELCAFVIASLKAGQLAFYRTADDLQNSIDNEEIVFDKKAFDWAREVDLLVVDDVGSERPRFKTNHIERILNYRLDYGKKTVFSISCDGEKFAQNYDKVSRRVSMFSGVLFRSRG